MCNACVVDYVKSSMLSRRLLFRNSVAAGVAALAASTLSARETLAQSKGQVTDLTYKYDEKFPTYDGDPGITKEKVVDFKRDGYNIYKLSIFEHTGTHIDAPLHFSEDGTSVADLDAANLVCPLCIINISKKAVDDANAMVERADVEAWQSANGKIPAGACVVMNSGWSAHMGQPTYRNTPDGKLAFPGFSKAAADLLAEMGVAAIGVDTLSLDPGNSTDFGVHSSWLPDGRYGIENLTNLDKLPVTGATIFVGAPKHAGGTGGPARILAVS